MWEKRPQAGDITEEWAGPGLCAAWAGSVHLCHATLRNRNVLNNRTEEKDGVRRGESISTLIWSVKIELYPAIKGQMRQVQTWNAAMLPAGLKTTKTPSSKVAVSLRSLKEEFLILHIPFLLPPTVSSNSSPLFLFFSVPQGVSSPAE